MPDAALPLAGSPSISHYSVAEKRHRVLVAGCLAASLTAAAGSAEYASLALQSIGHEAVFYWYVTAMMVVAFLVAWRLPKEAKYLHHDH